MTLAEAKEILNSIDIIDLKETHDVTDETYSEAIDTVLKALEDSISKDKVRSKMEEMNKTIKNAEPIEAVFMIKQQQALHELLMGE